MQEKLTFRSHKILFLNTLVFTICFSVWMLNSVLVTFLANNQVFNWGAIEIGWLMGIPVLTGTIMRLPAGILTDKFGGRPVMTILLILCAIPTYLLGHANSFIAFALCSFGFGLIGTSFAVGIAFSSIWYPKKNQGFALGIFGSGNCGAALTAIFAPTLLKYFTDDGKNINGWRSLPVFYTIMLLITAFLFFIFSNNKKPKSSNKTFIQMLSPLRKTQVWRFGAYYFLVFGCFVAFSNWLVPYFINVYNLPLVLTGVLVSSYSFSSGIIRALGGWLSDKFGAREVMRWTLISSAIVGLMLSIPKMEIFSAGNGIMSTKNGIVQSVSSSNITIDGLKYSIVEKPSNFKSDDQFLIFPNKKSWQESVVKVGQKIQKKELLARGKTRIYFQANLWIYVVLVVIIGSIWGIGSAAVFKHVTNYYPNEVGLIGGMVGKMGGLGGFSCPIIFGYMLDSTGLWTSCWVFVLMYSLFCYILMNNAINKINRQDK